MVPIDLTGRVALVTGAARGIGEVTARRLVEAGCTVVLNVRQLDGTAEEAVARLEALRPGSTHLVAGPVDEPATAKTLAREIFERYRCLDILVNNAGILRDNFIGMIPDEEIELVMRNNVYGVIRLTQAMARLMARKRSGAIVNLASIIGVRGNAGQLVYGASKAAVIGATLSAAKELAPQGIRVNAVAPGFIATRMTDALPKDSRDRLVANIGMGRPGTPEDVADTILFLVSDLARYVTGQVIGVDGGLVL